MKIAVAKYGRDLYLHKILMSLNLGALQHI